MRKAFFESLYKHALSDGRITICTADMGFGLLEPFKDNLPRQYINCGISEQNTISVAAGMASQGRLPYCYSITPFITSRCHEQTRIDVCYNNRDVKIIGAGQGFDYGVSGPTHFATDDISIMRALPNMSVVCPADAIEAAALPHELLASSSPAYIRLGRGGEHPIHNQPVKCQYGASYTIQKADDPHLTVISAGSISWNAMQACRDFDDVEFISMPWIKPIDHLAVIKASRTGTIMTVEEHSRIGGLHSAVLESLSMNKRPVDTICMALPDSFEHSAGSQDYLRKKNGLDIDSIREMIAAHV